MVVNLVRSGRKQPQLFSASAGGQARHPFLFAEDHGGAGSAVPPDSAMSATVSEIIP